MLREKTVEYDSCDARISVTVVRATVLVGARRSVSRVEASELIKEAGDEMPHEVKILRGITYPDLIVCTVEAQGIPWPLSFDDFLELDDEFVDMWWDAVREVNPHWYARQPDEETTKKATNFTEE